MRFPKAFRPFSALLHVGAFSTFASASSHLRAHTRQLDQSQYDECTFLVDRLEVDPEVDAVIPPDFSEITFDCELSSHMILPLLVDATQKESLESSFLSGELRSSESTIILSGSGATITDEGIQIPPGHTIEYSEIPTERRRLAILTGDKPILAIKVKDINGLARGESTDAISGDIFGGFGDNLNLKSQMSACSFGALNILAGDPPTDSAKEHEVSPGVIEVTIPISLTNNDRYTIHNAVVAAAETKLGFNLPGPYHHVMIILEKCYIGCGWAAYAYINSWMSVYQADYYKMVGVQMHGKCDILVVFYHATKTNIASLKLFLAEIGHNFALAHSGGLNNQPYTDHTGHVSTKAFFFTVAIRPTAADIKLTLPLFCIS